MTNVGYTANIWYQQKEKKASFKFNNKWNISKISKIIF